MKRLAAVVAAAAAVALAVWRLQTPAPQAPPPEPERVVAHVEVPPTPAPAPPRTASPATAKLTELRALSDSVLRGTFVVAIRAAGYVCEDVVAVDQGEPGAPVWRARCPGLLAYLVGVNDAGGLTVEPTLDHLDSVGPAPIAPPRGSPPDLLGPREPRR